jgi:hypothetical protein
LYCTTLYYHYYECYCRRKENRLPEEILEHNTNYKMADEILANT